LTQPHRRWNSDDQVPHCKESIFANLHPGVPVDALELRVDVNDMYLPVESVVFHTQGAPCSSAPDVASCKSAFAKARPAEVLNQYGLPLNQEYLVYSRASEVGIVQGAAVGAFLAPIDNEAEATAPREREEHLRVLQARLERQMSSSGGVRGVRFDGQGWFARTYS
jgi:hypothetical protein